MSGIRDCYNKIYLYVNTKLDKNIGQFEKDKKLDNAINRFFEKMGAENVPASYRRSMKVKIIQTYKTSLDNPKNLSQESLLKQAIQTCKTNTKRKLIAAQIPSDPIVFKPIQNYKEKKEAYLTEIKNSTNKQDQKIQEFLKKPEVQELAAFIEQDFEMHQHLASLNLATDMTLKDFANLMLSKYQPAVLDIFTELGQKTATRDDKINIYFAILLLQKGDDFTNAIQALIDLNYKIDSSMQAFLAPLMSECANPLTGIEAISRYEI